MSLVDAEAIRSAGLKAVLDRANGAGSVTAPQLLDDLNVRAVTLNSNPQGTFPGHPSEPVEAHLQDLISLVKASGADLGIAHDGDADRTIFVDDKGRYLYGDRSLAIVAEHMVRENNGGIVVTPVSSSMAVEDAVKRAGGEVVYTRVGAPVVARKMIETGAVFGGEENGGLIFPRHQYCRDGAMTVAKLLEIIATEGPLSELVDRIPQYCQDKRKMVCRTIAEAVLSGLVALLRSGWTPRRRQDRFEGGWTLVRPSGTEPLFRIYTEARTEVEARSAPVIARRCSRAFSRAKTPCSLFTSDDNARRKNERTPAIRWERCRAGPGEGLSLDLGDLPLAHRHHVKDLLARLQGVLELGVDRQGEVLESLQVHYLGLVAHDGQDLPLPLVDHGDLDLVLHGVNDASLLTVE